MCIMAYQGNDNKLSLENLQKTAKYLTDRTQIKPLIGIICGSGLGSLAETLENQDQFCYGSIPNFPRSTVEGHQGLLVFGTLSGVPVVCMQGRFHYYEGYSLSTCVIPIRVMKLIGVEYLFATNAAGGLNSCYKVGDIMILKDHVNLMGFAGNNPLIGPNENFFGPRFLATNDAYDRDLIKVAKTIAGSLGIEKNVHEGVYSCVGGPTYESVAEIKLLKSWGIDAIGMSTVHEIVAARHANLTVFTFSLITNEAIDDYESKDKPSHEEVVKACKAREPVLKEFVKKMVEHVGKINKK